MTRIKICGLRTPADIAAANESRPDYIGFILSPGYRRSITKEQALALREQLDPGIVPVGGFVNATPAYIQACVDCGAGAAKQRPPLACGQAGLAALRPSLCPPPLHNGVSGRLRRHPRGEKNQGLCHRRGPTGATGQLPGGLPAV